MQEIGFLVQNKNTVILPAYAKVNLFLRVDGLMDNGYHSLNMIMQGVSLHDDVMITVSKKEGSELIVSMHKENMVEISDINMHDNIVYKVSRAFLDRFKIKNNIKIRVIKKIPGMAGLAGGSSDAAAALLGLNMYFETGLSTLQLQEMSKDFGADIPFCLSFGTAIAEGIGEELKWIKPTKKLYIVIAMPKKGISTKEAFNIYDSRGYKADKAGFENIKRLIGKDSMDFIGHMYNDFENIARSIVPDIEVIEKDFERMGATKAMVTGSGSAVFALFLNKTDARACYDKMRKNEIIAQMFFTESL